MRCLAWLGCRCHKVKLTGPPLNKNWFENRDRSHCRSCLMDQSIGLFLHHVYSPQGDGRPLKMRGSCGYNIKHLQRPKFQASYNRWLRRAKSSEMAQSGDWPLNSVPQVVDLTSRALRAETSWKALLCGFIRYSASLSSAIGWHQGISSYHPFRA